MDDLEEKLNSVLNNPQMMQQIMAMAQGFGDKPQKPTGPKPEQPPPCAPEMDMRMLQNISKLARQSSIDKREQALLRALGAYLSKDRIGRLEKAMKAAKLAQLASTAMGPGSPFKGR